VEASPGGHADEAERRCVFRPKRQRLSAQRAFVKKRAPVITGRRGLSLG
jgi:hypothetical protein